MTEKSLAIGAERCRLLKAARPWFEEGLPLVKVAQVIGTSPGNLSRLRQQFGHLEDHQITPETCAGHTGNSGRRSTWSEFARQEEVQKILKSLYLLTTGASSDYMTHGRRTGSLALTLERFADDDICPPALAAMLRAGSQPAPLVRVIRQITAEIEARHRGNKHQDLHGTLIQRRTLTETLADGSTTNIAPGDWWVFDDASDNQPFWFTDADGTPMVGRQGLYGYDITRKWLGVELVGTCRDSYTAAIILRFFRRLMQALGKPRRGIVLERSVWQSRTIAGFKLNRNGVLVQEDVERPAMDDGEKDLVQDGLRALGLELHYTYTPRGKEIEGAFNYLQRVLPTFAPAAVNIGRHAGEFEHGAKQLRRARAGVAHPEKLGFAHIDARADVIEQCMAWIDARTRDRDQSDAERWQQSIQDRPLSDLSQRDMAAFLPEVRELSVHGGKVTATVRGQMHDFTHPEVFAEIGSGYRVYVRFDPAEPTLGAAIYNRETSTANHQGWQQGQFMCWADALAPVDRFDWRTGGDDPQADAKRRFNTAVRTAFRAVGMPKHSAGTARDGRGNVVEFTKGNSPERPERRAQAAKPRQRLVATPEEFTRQSDRLARMAARARALENIES